MRRSKKRRFTERTRRLHLLVEESVYDKLNRMAGPESLGYMVEELIEREYRRREKRMVHVPKISMQESATMS